MALIGLGMTLAKENMAEVRPTVSARDLAVRLAPTDGHMAILPGKVRIL